MKQQHTHVLTPHVSHQIQQEIRVEPSRDELIAPLLSAIEEQANSSHPFDEPLHEYGEQLDGRLRPEWLRAYYRKQRTYVFNGDRYSTFRLKDKERILQVPQVCADFIIDTIDASAGTHYTNDLKNPKRVVGAFDLRQEIVTEKLEPRRVSDIIDFFRKRNEDFTFVFEGKGPALGSRDTPEWVRQRVLPGDIIIVSGRVPWDLEKEHTHSMFVFSTGEELQVASNPGTSRITKFDFERYRTPKRRITHIVRLTDAQLKKLQNATIQ